MLISFKTDGRRRERESTREAMMKADRISPQLHVTETEGRRRERTPEKPW
jgi:hypothetical protein